MDDENNSVMWPQKLIRNKLYDESVQAKKKDNITDLCGQFGGADVREVPFLVSEGPPNP